MSGFIYLYEDDDRVHLPIEKQIATIKNVSNDARWKSAQQLSWKPLKINYPLGAGDSLYSGEDSKIEVVFKNQNELALHSNTLVILDQAEPSSLSDSHRMELNMSYGQVELKSNKDTDWKIKNHEEQIEVKSGPLSQTHIEIGKNKSFEVALKNGDADVTHNGTSKKLNPSVPHEIFISASALLEIKNFAKENGINSSERELKNIPETIVHIIDDREEDNTNTEKNLSSKEENQESTKKESLPTNNSLKVQSAAAIEKKSKLQANSKSQKSDKKTIEKKGASDPNVNAKSNTELKAATPSESEQIENRISKLVTNSQYSPPKAKVPFHESVVYLYKGNKLNIHFIWTESQKKAKSYVIQVATNDLFKPTLITKLSTSNKIDIDLPSTGKFFWKVKSVYNDDSSPWSEVKYFVIEHTK